MVHRPGAAALVVCVVLHLLNHDLQATSKTTGASYDHRQTEPQPVAESFKWHSISFSSTAALLVLIARIT
ncbi:hypothetical protein OK016_15390 [Vibrio chagasii]|nr:hypothetical protein [Vibrio chagasii]